MRELESVFKSAFEKHLDRMRVKKPAVLFVKTPEEAMAKASKLHAIGDRKHILVNVPEEAGENDAMASAFSQAFQYARFKAKASFAEELNYTAVLLGIYLHARDAEDEQLTKDVQDVAKDDFEEYKQTPFVAQNPQLLGSAIAHVVLNERKIPPDDIERLLLLLSRKKFEGARKDIEHVVSDYDRIAIEGRALMEIETEDLVAASGNYQGNGAALIKRICKNMTSGELRKMLEEQPGLQALVFVDRVGKKLQEDPEYLKKLVAKSKSRLGKV